MAHVENVFLHDYRAATMLVWVNTGSEWSQVSLWTLCGKQTEYKNGNSL